MVKQLLFVKGRVVIGMGIDTLPCFHYSFSSWTENMATYQGPQVVTLTLDKQKLFDHLKLLFAEPEKVTMNMDDVLKAAAVGEIKEPMEVDDDVVKSYDEKVLKDTVALI